MTPHPGAERYPAVFRPLRLGPVEVPNRIYMAPHGIPLEAPTAGWESYHEPAVNRVHYFAERAAGGTGLIVHSTQVAPFAAQGNLSEVAGLREAIPSYRRVAEGVHEHGARIMAEIWYVNWLQKRWEKLGPEMPALAPSAVGNLNHPSGRRAMTRYEIGRMRDAHAVAARHLREAGYDGIELHVSHGSIVEYFLSGYFNHRTDEYGGSLENRMRFMVETLEAIKAELSDEMALGLRLTVDEMVPDGIDLDQTRAILRSLERSGLLDFVDLDISFEPEQLHLMTTGMFDPVLHNAPRVAAVREAAGALPVLCTPGRLTAVADAERLIDTGVADMVGAVRGLIADPELVAKAREGREPEQRVCVAVNACIDPFGVGWGCAINAAAGREHRWGARATATAPRAMRVVVVGGGPAGLEAARVARVRGHDVTLLEREPEIGGGVALWSAIPGRESMAALPRYFRRALADLGVDVRTGVEADAAAVLALDPEVAVIATGSRYRRDGASGFAPRPVPGHERGLVVAAEAVIRGDVRLSGNVVVLDDEGYHTASGVAEIAASTGAAVEYVTRKATVAPSLGIAIGYVARRLRDAGVAVRTGAYLRAIGDGTVTVYEIATGAETVLEADHVVLATTRQADDALHAALEDALPFAYLIGDALAPRGLREATYEGQRFARVIGEPSMPASVSEELFAANEHALRPAASGPA